MRKMFSIFFLMLYLVSSTEFYQLLKVPILVEHFIEHKEKDKMSLLEYLVHHYGGHEKDDDWDTDMKLPFMTHFETLNTAFNFTPFQVEILPKKICHQETGHIVNYDHTDINSVYLSTIWQPPKFC